VSEICAKQKFSYLFSPSRSASTSLNKAIDTCKFTGTYCLKTIFTYE